MTMSLEFLGYDVIAAGTVRDALAIGRRESFDVVVSDLGLPDGSGLELGPVLGGRAPLIALSGFGSPVDVARSLASGFAAHLVKPTDPEYLHATIGTLLMQAATAD